MGSASIFNGNYVRTLKQNLSLNGATEIQSGTVDPTSVATTAPIGAMYMNTSNGLIYRKLDAGSSTNWEILGAAGSSGINYITNSGAQANTTGWATYADAAGAVPVDGTGGSPNVTWTRSTTTPLRGIAEFNFVKDAANRQGQGVSAAFTIDLADRAKIMQISFDYDVVSGTYSGGTSSTNSDLIVYIYDVTNAVLIEPSSIKLDGSVSGVSYNLSATFQTASNSSSYRLIVHCSTTSAVAYTLGFDNVQVGPQLKSIGSFISDWVAYVPTFSGFGTPSAVAFEYKRVGGSIYVRGKFISGTNTGAAAFFTLPTGVAATNAANENFLVGEAQHDDTSRPTAALYIDTSVSTSQVRFWNQLSGTSGIGALVGSSFASSKTVSVTMGPVKVAGWGSSTSLSSADTQRRVGATVVRAASSQTIATTATKVQWNSVASDTHGTFDSITNHRYTVPVAGSYVFSGALNFAATASVTSYAVYLYKNGSAIRTLLGIGSATVNFGGAFSFDDAAAVAGDYYEIFAQMTGASVSLFSSASLNGGSRWAIDRQTSGQTIAASESIFAVYNTAAAPAMAEGALTTVVYNTRVSDSHGALDAATGIFTCPAAGFYQVSAAICWGTFTDGTIQLFEVHHNVTAMGAHRMNIVTATNFSQSVSVGFYCQAGDTIRARGYQDNSTGGTQSKNLNNEAKLNFISISRTGGV